MKFSPSRVALSAALLVAAATLLPASPALAQEDDAPKPAGAVDTRPVEPKEGDAPKAPASGDEKAPAPDEKKPDGAAPQPADGGGTTRPEARDEAPSGPRVEPVLPEGWLELGPDGTYRKPPTGGDDRPPTGPSKQPGAGAETGRPARKTERKPAADKDQKESAWARDTIRLGVYASAFIPSGDLDLEPAPALGARAAYRLGRDGRVLLGADFGFATFDFTDRDDRQPARIEDTARVFVFRFDLEAIYELEATKDITVQLLGGIGLTAFTSFPDESDRVDPTGIVGAGIHYWLSDFVSIGAEARVRLIYTRFQQDSNGISMDFDPRLGIELHF